MKMRMKMNTKNKMNTTDHKTMNKKLNILMVGAGGIASYLFPVLIKSFPIDFGVIFDRDSLEERNLERQNFQDEFVGRNKAQSLISQYEAGSWTAVEEWIKSPLSVEWENFPQFNVILSCVDNHPTRKALIRIAKTRNIPLINGANETRDNEAWLYIPDCHGDPLVTFPEIGTDKTGSPWHCDSEEAQQTAPQIALANMGAAYKMLSLLDSLYRFYITQDEATGKALFGLSMLPDADRDQHTTSIPIYYERTGTIES